MTYVRKKTIKGHDYSYRVKSVRTPKGPRQKVIKYLGKTASVEPSDRVKIKDEVRIEVVGFPSKQYYEKVSRETGFLIEKLEIVYRLNSFLNEMGKEKILDRFAMRGGTALNLIYFNIARLSVDIDLNYVGHTNKEKMLEERGALREKIKAIARRNGYEPHLAKSYSQDRFDFYYKNVYGQKAHIKVEVNYMNRISVLKDKKRVLKTPFKDVVKVKVKTHQFEELYGSKLAAMIERGHPRDVYDAYTLHKVKKKSDVRLMRKCFVFYATLKGDYKSWGKKVELTERGYSDHVKPLLGSERPPFREVRGGAQKILSTMLKLNKSEKQYIAEFYKNKRCNPTLLFRKGEASDNLDKHPSVLQALHRLSRSKVRIGRGAR